MCRIEGGAATFEGSAASVQVADKAGRKRQRTLRRIEGVEGEKYKKKLFAAKAAAQGCSGFLTVEPSVQDLCGGGVHRAKPGLLLLAVTACTEYILRDLSLVLLAVTATGTVCYSHCLTFVQTVNKLKVFFVFVFALIVSTTCVPSKLLEKGIPAGKKLCFERFPAEKIVMEPAQENNLDTQILLESLPALGGPEPIPSAQNLAQNLSTETVCEGVGGTDFTERSYAPEQGMLGEPPGRLNQSPPGEWFQNGSRREVLSQILQTNFQSGSNLTVLEKQNDSENCRESSNFDPAGNEQSVAEILAQVEMGDGNEESSTTPEYLAIEFGESSEPRVTSSRNIFASVANARRYCANLWQRNALEMPLLEHSESVVGGGVQLLRTHEDHLPPTL